MQEVLFSPSSFWIFSSIASLNYILGKWYGRPSDIYIQKDHLTQETTTITKDTESETSTSVTTATEPIGARKFEKTNIKDGKDGEEKKSHDAIDLLSKYADNVKIPESKNLQVGN